MKRRTICGIGLGVGALLAIPAALRLSPWPGALLIKQLFNHGDAQTLARLARHVPAGIRQQRDLAYGPDPDERLDLYLPAAAGHPLPTLVWVHGGGWVGGSRQAVSHWLQIVASAGHACVAVGYSTSRPDARYPTPLQQVNRALGHLQRHAGALGLDLQRLVLGGSSAGAQISAQLALLGSSPGYARRVGIVPDSLLTRLRGLVLLSGAFDLAGVGRNWFVDSLLWAYTGKRDFRTDAQLQLMAITPNVSARFPPCYLTSGNADPLLPQALALDQRLRTLGVEVDSLFFAADHRPPLLHEYQFNLDSAEGRLSQQRLLAFLARVCA